ncbi:MAG TPA: lipoyl(octanoyl) transferase LipB [Burkholderiales bacterium]|nr:lipoyl(octanoyl) transferase LipB [Burkholderiales bacterium]
MTGIAAAESNTFERELPARPAHRIARRELGRVDYTPTWEAMKAFTGSRTATTADEIWLLEHFPVYTYGVAGRAEHLPRVANAIPCIKVDRGGQITYHGPGQVVLYTLMDLRRLGLTVRGLVQLLEQSVLDLLNVFGIRGERREGAPGVYVDGAKIAALGLRVRNGCAYHGLSFNVDVELAPFSAIDPCGYPNLPVTRLRDFGVEESAPAVGGLLASHIVARLEAIRAPIETAATSIP